MSGDCGSVKEFDFKYESDASSSFLVASCESGIIEFQARMLENNAIPYIVPVETVNEEGAYRLYYNITSRIPLSLYLKRNKLSRVEFLKLLLNISTCVNNSAGYLLSASNFIFDPEYIYIEPETMEARLVYIPAETGGSTGGTIQTLVSDLLMQHVHEDGAGGGELVQRILPETKSEMFSIRSFMILLNELLYGGRSEDSSVAIPVDNFCDKILENSSKNDNIEEKQEDKENNAHKISLSMIMPIVILQLFMGILIFLCRGFLDNIGENRTTTYVAVAMIVIAIDVLVFKKLQPLKLFDVKSTNSQNATQQDSTAHVPAILQKLNAFQLHNPSKRAESKENMSDDSRSGCVEPSAVRAYERLKKLTVEETACSFMTDRTGAVQEAMVSKNEKNSQIQSYYSGNTFILKSKGKYSGERDIIIDREETIVGRLQGRVDHVLLNNAVGKLHAELILRNGTCFVKDLNSINGTYINDERIESNKEVALKNNDHLQFADSEYVFVCGRQ